MPRKSNFALRLPASLKTEAEQVAKEEGTTLNQLINIALAEKLAVWRTTKFFEERAARADSAAVGRLLDRVGNEPPRPGDEIPEDVDLNAIRKRLVKTKRQA
jgi:hypothetical protein